MPQHGSERGTLNKLNDQDYTASCASCGSTKDIQLWPHRNEYGNMVGFLFMCSGCKESAPGVKIVIHGIRHHDENDLQECFTKEPNEMKDCNSVGHYMCKECTRFDNEQV